MYLAILYFFAGLSASAFFSGSETGLYRVPRVRLVLDGMEGSTIARFLLWLTNHPAAFVSTVLVGNNIANYVASAGLVGIASLLLGASNTSLELLLTIIATPILFIYGELLPKSLFYNAPFRLLTLSGYPLLIVTLLLSPISFLLYSLSVLVQRFSGETPFKVLPALARRELKRMLQESREIGLLNNVQRDVAQNILAYGGTSIRQYCTPTRALKIVPSDVSLTELHAAAAKSTFSIIGVKHPRHDRLIGYFRMSDIIVATQQVPKLRALLTLSSETSQAVALSQMLSHKCELGRVVDSSGAVIGVLLQQRLLGQMLQQD